jgi:hypothetical protein
LSGTVRLDGLSTQTWIALLSGAGILIHLSLRYLLQTRPEVSEIPLYVTVAAGGLPLLWKLGQRLIHLEFGSDLLAGLSIVAAAVTDQYLVAPSLFSCFPAEARSNRTPRSEPTRF